MCTNDQALTQKGFRMQPKTMDPAERRRRLRKVYDILLGLAGKAESAALDTPCDQPQPVD